MTKKGRRRRPRGQCPTAAIGLARPSPFPPASAFLSASALLVKPSARLCRRESCTVHDNWLRHVGAMVGGSVHKPCATKPCGPLLAAVALRQWVQLAQQRCARSWVAAPGGVFSETTHDCCGMPKRRPCGLAPASISFEHFRQTVWATDGRVPAEQVERNFLQQLGLERWSLKPILFASSRLVPTHGWAVAQMSRAAAPWSNPRSCLGNAFRCPNIWTALLSLFWAQHSQQLWGSNRRPCRPAGEQAPCNTRRRFLDNTAHRAIR